MNCGPPDSSVHGILQARILVWLPFSSPEDLPDPGIEPGFLALQADALLSKLLALTNGRLPVCTLVDFSSLGDHQLVPNVSFYSTKDKRTLAVSAEQGRNREDPQSKSFWQLLGISPECLTWLIHHEQVYTPSWLQFSPGKPRRAWCHDSTRGSQSQPRIGCQKSVTERVWKVGFGCWPLKRSINRPGLVESLLYFRYQQPGWVVEDICLKAIPPPLAHK